LKPELFQNPIVPLVRVARIAAVYGDLKKLNIVEGLRRESFFKINRVGEGQG
jgi:hypothetical protein